MDVFVGKYGKVSWMMNLKYLFTTEKVCVFGFAGGSW